MADLVVDTASEVGGRVHDVSGVLPGRHRRPKHHVRRLVLAVALIGALAMVFKWLRRSSADQGGGGMQPYPTDDPSYDQKSIDDAAERMGSTGHGTFDPDPTNSHDPGALDEAARRMGVEP